MVMWRYVADRRVTLKERQDMPRTLPCLCETSDWHRLASRSGAPSYQWLPEGYICFGCNMIWMGVP
jgi:hypothetical protein